MSSTKKITIAVLAILFIIIIGRTHSLYSKIEEIEIAQEQNEKLIDENLASLFMVYEIFDNNKQKMQIIRHGDKNDGGYIVAEKAFTSADTLLSYGLSNHVIFEKNFTKNYNKPHHIFDCGAELKPGKTHLIKECIASNNFIEDHELGEDFSNYMSQLKKLGLEDKKVFIKMDIDGAEYDAFKDIHQRSYNVTGIVLKINLGTLEQKIRAANLIANLNHDFYLIHVHANNCADKFSAPNVEGDMANVMELSFVHKSLVPHARISDNQSFPKHIDSPNCANKADYNYTLETNR